ncbi:MAG: M1 family metallopeptidase, partial [Cyclobacteriaceae bacterium]
MKYLRAVVVTSILLYLCGCQTKETAPSNKPLTTIPDEKQPVVYVKDPHSYAEPENVRVTHLDWEASVNFEDKVIAGVASLTLEPKSSAKELALDTKDLIIEKVTVGPKDNGAEIEFELAGTKPVLGSALIIQLDEATSQIHVYYKTSPNAEALQWLAPEQTAGKNQPFLFTQSQAILARSWIPIQDSPGIRFTYTAQVTVPPDLLALMSASNPKEKNDNGIYQFKMDQPIPAYLMALAVGDVAFAPIGDRSGVYAEPSVLGKAQKEFSELPKMITAAEELYGPYNWERYDLIVLPPSFPFGGMENPRLTFATPTILAGDRSLVSLVAHELAHSWSGNLVTNATWNDFWLNEGFTVYFENRIMEVLHGKDYSEMLALLALQDLEEEVSQFLEEKKEKDTHLKLDLSGRNPDDGMTSIAYDKGYYFLRWLEERVGRKNFDNFLKQYFSDNQFRSMTTSGFVEYMKIHLIEKHHINLYDEDYNQWIYGPGLPKTLPRPVSDRFEKVEASLSAWLGGAELSTLPTKSWSTHEWLHFIKSLPDSIQASQIEDLDQAFDLTHSGNSEVQAVWYKLAIERQYEPTYPEIEKFLIEVGRRKFLTPLYKAMAKTEPGLSMAKNIYSQARPNYHAVSRSTIDTILGWEE